MVAKTRRMTISRKTAPCPCCGSTSKRHSTGRRRLREIGILGPTILEVTHSKHYCERCRKHFSIDMSHIAPPHGRFTHGTMRTAVALVNNGATLEKASYIMRMKYHVRVPATTIFEWCVRYATAA